MEQAYPLKKMWKKVSKYEYVSFDVFDTLIKRNVQRPHDIFRLVELKYNKGNNKKIENYTKNRIEAEQKAKTKFENGECTFNSIFEELKNIYSEETVNKLKMLELEFENKYCIQNKDFYSIYKNCLNDGKKIIIISDMYLDKDTIEKILHKNGIDGYKDIFVSSEVKLNKHNGTIYPYVLKKLGIKKKQIIHIGDSKRADYIMAIKNGIKAILIPKRINKLKYYNEKEYEKLNDNEKLSYRTIETFINNNIPISENTYYKLGYEVLGILLYGYTNWLIKELKEKNINKIFFLAREGACLKRAFDILNDSEIESKYLYASRRSTRVPLLKDINNFEDIFKIVKMRKITDIKSFFINVGLDVANYSELLHKYNYQETTNIKNIENIDQFFEEIKPDIIENAKKEEENLLGYLKQEDFTGVLAVADVGWKGTMQNALSSLSAKFGLNAGITGFYMGQSQAAKKYADAGINTKAYLFDYTSDGYDEIRPFLNLFESFFLAQHGTTLKYEYKDNKYSPVLDKCEYSNGEKEIFKRIQDGAIQFINDYKLYVNSEVDLYSQCSFLGIKKLGLNPTLKDVNLFCNITYLETIKATFASPRNIFYYMIHPKKLYIDFCNCSWKIGFLKKLFKIKLPYVTIFNRLAKIEKK